MTTVVMPSSTPLGIKLIASIFGGAIATFLLFVLMHQLINKPVPEFIVKSDHPVIAVTLEDRDETVRIPPREILEPPKQKKSPPPVELEVEPMDPSGMDENSFRNYNPATNIETNISAPIFTKTNGSATPIVRVEPNYPVTAAAGGIEGWVRLNFTINKLGKVENIKVLESEPKRVFDKSAKRALKKWKYRPKMEQGVAVAQPNMNVMLSFNLQE